MRVVILGAGEVGKQLARVLSIRKNDVVVVDSDAAVLEHLKEHIDVMTVVGNGAAARTLTRAGIDKADLFLAVTNNSEANILACGIAQRFKVPKKIARVRSGEYFDSAHDLGPEAFGIDDLIIPEYECASNIMDALLRPAIKETVKFSHPEAQMVNFQVKPGSPMIGVRLKDFPRTDLLEQLRMCAILRYGQLIIPRGDTSFLAFDEVYVAGGQSVIDDLISWANPKHPYASKVIIAGGSSLGRTLATMLAALDMRVCLTEPTRSGAEESADKLGSSAVIIEGKGTDISVLEEAGIEHCDAFIAAHDDNETNIISCILAKRHGAGKVIAVTNHPDYIPIIAGMNMIDCGFSPLVAAVNNLLQHISSDSRRTVALLKRTPAEVLEMTVLPDSPVKGQRIMDLKITRDIIFALILREDRLVPAVGPELLLAGDRVAILATSQAVPDVERLFERGFLS